MIKIDQHPRNEKISFDKEKHEYIFDGDRKFEGVTSLIGKYTEPFDVEKIAKKVAKSRGVTKQEILDEWEDARKYGNYVHEIIENYVNDEIDFNVKEIDKFRRIMARRGLKPLKAEWVIYDEDIERASAIDLICKKDDKIVICDLKTMEKPIRFNSYRDKRMKEPLDDLPDSKYYKQALQVNIYKYWLEEKYDLDVSSVNYILRLRNNVCKLIPVIDLKDKIEKIYENE